MKVKALALAACVLIVGGLVVSAGHPPKGYLPDIGKQTFEWAYDVTQDWDGERGIGPCPGPNQLMGGAPASGVLDGLELVFEHYEEFLQFDLASIVSGAATGAYIATEVEEGAGDTAYSLASSMSGGFLIITNAANEDDGTSIQMNGEPFKLADNKPLWFGASFKCVEATDADWLIGLCITDTALLGGMTDGLYFEKLDGSTTVSFVTEKDSTETTGTIAVDDAAFHTVGFYFDGNGSVIPWYDGAQFTAHTTNIPDDEQLTLSFECLNGEAVAHAAYIDWIRVVQAR